MIRRKPLCRREALKKMGIPVKARGQYGAKRKKPLVPKRAITKWKKRQATPVERAHMAAVASLSCIACTLDGVENRANLHHVRAGYGTAQRASHWEVLPLCEGHHQGMIDTTKPVAFHRAEKTFVLRYGNEILLLQWVWFQLQMDFSALPEIRGGEPPWWEAFQRGFYDREIDVKVKAQVWNQLILEE